MRQTISAADARLSWAGAVSVQRKDGWVQPWRLPFHDLALYDPGVVLNAAVPAGVRLRFGTDAESFALLVEAMAGEGCIDVYANGAFLHSQSFASAETEILCTGLPAGHKELECWLPPHLPFRLREVRLPGGAEVVQSADTRPKWVTYGSSITHCSGAESPSATWPGVVAMGNGYNLTSLGLNGQCHADPMVARLLRDLPADLISVKLGINISGQSSMNERTFSAAIFGTIATIRDGHPATPLLMCSPIWCPDRENTPNRVEITLTKMRATIQKVVESFQARGDQHIYYINGLDLFGAELQAYLPDGLHPDGQGYRKLGMNFMRELDRLGLSPR